MADSFDYLTGSVSDMLNGTTSSQVQTPAVAASPLSTSFWSGAGDFISQSLGLWQQYETVQKVKDSGSQGQQEVIKTVQTTNPNSDQTYVDPSKQQANAMAQKLASLTQLGTGAYIGIGAAILLGFYLMKK